MDTKEKGIKRFETLVGKPSMEVELSNSAMDILFEMAEDDFDFYYSLLTFINEKNKNEWICRYFIALCKESLGHIRTKYSGPIPIPFHDIHFNGNVLIEDARIEKERLIQMITRVKQ